MLDTGQSERELEAPSLLVPHTVPEGTMQFVWDKNSSTVLSINGACMLNSPPARQDALVGTIVT